jgi:hypothetical protein
MNVWFRVFGTNDTAVEPAAVLEHGSQLRKKITGKFRGDDKGWFEAHLAFEPAEPFTPFLQIDRFLADEDGIRHELNTWAAWLETKEEHPQHARLMQQIISTRQLFVAHADTESGDGGMMRVCWSLQKYLARETDGIYQVEGRGFYSADGTLLIPE